MRCAWWLVFVTIGFSTRAVAAQGNDLSAPTGGRSALMGNTGVALARDGAAPFYNPATWTTRCSAATTSGEPG
jgi:hypothetical protein